MKNMEKKVVALVLALVMVCSMIVTALAEEVATVTDLLPVDETTVASDPVDATVIEVTDDVTPDAPAAEVPAEETTEVPAEETTEVPAEETNEVPAEETAEEAAEEEFVFTGSVAVRMLNTGDIYIGDTVILHADVSNANAEYTISWEVCEDGIHWETVKSGTVDYSFVVTEENAGYAYRAVLTVAE